jgi:hypothetical protein
VLETTQARRSRGGFRWALLVGRDKNDGPHYLDQVRSARCQLRFARPRRFDRAVFGANDATALDLRSDGYWGQGGSIHRSIDLSIHRSIDLSIHRSIDPSIRRVRVCGREQLWLLDAILSLCEPVLECTLKPPCMEPQTGLRAQATAPCQQSWLLPRNTRLAFSVARITLIIVDGRHFL